MAKACTIVDENSVSFSKEKVDLQNGKIEYRLTAKNKLSSPLAMKLSFKLKNAKVVAGDDEVNFKPNEEMLVAIIRSINSKKSSTFNFKALWQIGKFAGKPKNYIYRLPYKSGQEYFVTQAYKSGITHKGLLKYAVDWKMRVGTKIYAARPGIVIAACEKYSKGGHKASLKNQANRIEILHDDGSIATYAHLEKNGVAVRLGSRVKRGQFIGYSGNTGFTNAPHLHFQVGYLDKNLKIRTVPTKFETQSGRQTLVRGKSYTASR